MRETTATQCPIHPLETQPCPTCNEGTRAGRTVNRSKLPLSAFGDILGHNYWMDATSLMKLWRRMQDAAQAEQTSGGVDGHAAIFGECVRPERQTPIANPTAGIKPGPLDHQSAATPSTSVGDDAQHGAAQAVTDGPAADPIDDLCERLCALHIIDEVGSNNPLGREAAAILERLRAERDCLKHELAEVRSVLQVTIAARNTYMAERNFLAAIVRAAWKEEA